MINEQVTSHSTAVYRLCYIYCNFLMYFYLHGVHKNFLFSLFVSNKLADSSFQQIETLRQLVAASHAYGGWHSTIILSFRTIATRYKYKLWYDALRRVLP